MARKLVSKERSKEDQRRVGLRVTEEASKLLVNAPGPAEGILPEALSALPVETMLSLDSSLEKIIQQLQIRDDRLAGKPLSDL